MTRAELEAMLEYSCSSPTETTIGKRWRRDACAYARFVRAPADEPHYPRLDEGSPESRFRGPEWWQGRYVPHPDPELVCIEWRPIVLVDEPAIEWARAW